MNSPKSDKELDEWLELLSSSTHSPQEKFSAEKTYNILQQRLQPAYRKHKNTFHSVYSCCGCRFRPAYRFRFDVLLLPTSVRTLMFPPIYKLNASNYRMALK